MSPRPPELARYRYLQREVSRYGRVMWYVRRPDKRRIRIRAEPGEPGFDTGYMEALKGVGRKAIALEFVYFIRSGARVKIGFSKDPSKRAGDLSVGSPTKLRVYYVTPGGRNLESELHRLFAHDRINGEWFIWTSRIADWIASDEAKRRSERP